MFLNDCFVSFAAVTCLKLLFLPLYKSTDFEVHRNWMAITYEKPFHQWYFEKTSEWTLDYPPLFAWFEYLLSLAAKYFDPKMLQISNLNYESLQTVFFMRLTVIISDIVYFYGVNRVYNLVKAKKGKTNDPWLSADVILAMLLLWNPGLLLVDHIHFQYNGFLSGILFISIADINQEKYVRAAFWFSVLINLKHIYLYLAPAYFLFLLKNYCFNNTGRKISFGDFSLPNFLKLASAGAVTVLFSFGPFIYMGQLNQVLNRLFPIKRGLTHSYWAPNIWAIYNFLDRTLSFVASYLKLHNPKDLQTCSTRGLVQECEHAILPTITTKVTLILAFLSLTPMIMLIWKKPRSFKVFLDSIILCSFGSFLFGYHVHEKAILLIILPLTISAVFHKEEANIYAFLSVVGHFSLFPLLHQEGETPLKILLLLLHVVYMLSSLSQLHKLKSLVSAIETVYLSGLVVLQVFYSFGAKAIGVEQKLPFLPLMLISTYCAAGVLYAWVKYCYLSLRSTGTEAHKIKRR